MKRGDTEGRSAGGGEARSGDAPRVGMEITERLFAAFLAPKAKTRMRFGSRIGLPDLAGGRRRRNAANDNGRPPGRRPF